MMKKSSYLLIAIFFLILITPTLDSIFHLSPVKELSEKRALATKPPFSFTAKTIKHYPQNFDNFYNDNFGFRKTLISANSKMMDKVFNQSPYDRAFIGKEGWLYLDVNGEFLDIQGKKQYDQKFLKNSVEALIANWKELKKNNIDYVLVIAPNKSTIYPEFLPDIIQSKFGNMRLDQFLLELIKQSPNFPVIDLRAPIMAAKTREQNNIYYKSDTHWNSIGAHYGYLEIIDFLSKKYHLNLKPKVRNDFVIKNKIKDGAISGDIADMMNLTVSDDIEYDLIPKKPFNYSRVNVTKEEQKQFHKPTFFINKLSFSENKSLPVLFSYKDSFSDHLIFFLPEHFSKSYFVNESHCKIDLNIIKKYHPNILIQEVVERKIDEVLESCLQ